MMETPQPNLALTLRHFFVSPRGLRTGLDLGESLFLGFKWVFPLGDLRCCWLNLYSGSGGGEIDTIIKCAIIFKISFPSRLNSQVEPHKKAHLQTVDEPYPCGRVWEKMPSIPTTPQRMMKTVLVKRDQRLQFPCSKTLPHDLQILPTLACKWGEKKQRKNL